MKEYKVKDGSDTTHQTPILDLVLPKVSHDLLYPILVRYHFQAGTVTGRSPLFQAGGSRVV